MGLYLSPRWDPRYIVGLQMFRRNSVPIGLAVWELAPRKVLVQLAQAGWAAWGTFRVCMCEKAPARTLPAGEEKRFILS